ncbi:hypothetical protein [Neobacillus endophyticus]|uniref:hypothetical protein n=1 Tax=Neobacillus endophyticus TaxID=2738405 RepID=UPI001FEB0EDC|nr:hypothetical protein [Neobacillus endophyticus]
MKVRFHIEVNKGEVSYESYDFFHEELDDLLIPSEHLEKLPDPLLLETLSYYDNDGYEWLAGVVVDETTLAILYEVWIKNGEQIAYELHIE